ncbi:MAG: NAD(P)H-hydrate epimerase, partial [Longimicrobiales bacterium]|nr:NAD(P)H-hydrate epimerase [Longimicrobiales bacterium]
MRCFAPAHLAVLSGSRSAQLDAWAMERAGVPGSALMERAGAGAAALVAHAASRGPVLVLAGGGNNGGDALVVARTLRAWGREVEVLLTAERAWPDPLLHGWDVPCRPSRTLADDVLSAHLQAALAREGAVVDGVLGTGARGAPRGEAERVVRLLGVAREAGTLRGRVVALDVPSGVDADTGEVAGAAVHAHLTVAFGWPKLGTLLHPGRARAGRLVALEIGFPPLPDDFAGIRLLTPAWAEARLPRRPPETHKNAVGAVAVVAGSPGMAGAAVLAARAALRAGAGFVRVVSPGANREIVQCALPEAVFVDAGDADAVADALRASRAVLAGPGLGTAPEAAALLERVLAHAAPLVLDADALNLLAGDPERRLRARPAPTVLTPHPGEAARL